MVERILLGFAMLSLAASIACGSAGLTIYFIDVEGGQSTLIVTPDGKSLLIDAGYTGNNGRDRDRILGAVRDAGLKQIDHLLVTHFHVDHAGGVPDLAERIPIGEFIDYDKPGGIDPSTAEPFKKYAKVRAQAAHRVAKPGDHWMLQDVRVEVLSAAGKLITQPLAGDGQPNPACTSYHRQDEDVSENPLSIGLELTFGKFRFLDLGDLSWNPLGQLVCPNNLIGHVDLFLVPHHTNNDSTVPAMLSALQPRTIISNNGPKKGGSPEALALVHGLRNVDVWQLHKSTNAGAANSENALLANIDDGQSGFGIKVTANLDGSFTVINQRNGAMRSYSAR